MKKIMFTAAAALCATVGFAIESANIVGYKQSSKGQGVDMGSAAFDAVGSAAVNIQDIVPVVGEGEELYTGGFMIMTMTDGGETGDTYVYTMAADSTDGIAQAGWFDMYGNRVNKTFLPGEGFVTVSDYETGKLQTAGQVAEDNTIFMLGTGVNSCGNTTSAPVPIANINVGVGVNTETGALLALNETTGEEIYTGGITIMTLTDGGETDETYVYTTAADATDGIAQAGWFDLNGNRVTISFDAGVGFIVVSDYEGGCIELPAAL